MKFNLVTPKELEQALDNFLNTKVQKIIDTILINFEARVEEEQKALQKYIDKKFEEMKNELLDKC